MKNKLSLSTDRKSAAEGEYIEIKWACDACPDSLYLAFDSGYEKYGMAVADSGTTRIPVKRSNGKTTITLNAVISNKKVSKSVDVKVKNAKSARPAKGSGISKKNGEGEWQIYKFNMNHKDYYWLLSVLGLPEDLGLKFGNDPGCTPVSEAYENAVAEAEAFVAAADTVDTTAKKHVEALLAHVAQLSAGKNPVVENTPYVLVASLPYFEKNGSEKVMTPGVGSVDGVEVAVPVWGNMPSEITEEVEFVFEAAAVQTENEAEAGNYFYIKNVANNQYIACTETGIFFTDAKEGNHFYVNNVRGAVWAFTRPGTDQAIHQQGHSEGSGSNGTLVYWSQTTGASQWYIMSVENATSIEDIVVEGDDVVSVAYYNAAGATLPAPAKGINVVVVVYANGVVETKKVLVK